MLSWPDFDIMSFGCSYSMNMYLCILGLAFFTAGLFLVQVRLTNYKKPDEVNIKGKFETFFTPHSKTHHLILTCTSSLHYTMNR